MKEFIVYTGLRVGMFLGTFAIVVGIWALVSGRNSVPVIWAAIAAMIISGAASYRFLNSQREALAHNVESRAARATTKFEEMKAREDND